MSFQKLESEKRISEWKADEEQNGKQAMDDEKILANIYPTNNLYPA